MSVLLQAIEHLSLGDELILKDFTIKYIKSSRPSTDKLYEILIHQDDHNDINMYEECPKCAANYITLKLHNILVRDGKVFRDNTCNEESIPRGQDWDTLHEYVVSNLDIGDFFGDDDCEITRTRRRVWKVIVRADGVSYEEYTPKEVVSKLRSLLYTN